ncbi:MAG TPA: response regulator [Bryobacteraceae bacterium]|nr:response regulator [Bryobacteraceae bacterium]
MPVLRAADEGAVTVDCVARGESQASKGENPRLFYSDAHKWMSRCSHDVVRFDLSNILLHADKPFRMRPTRLLTVSLGLTLAPGLPAIAADAGTCAGTNLQPVAQVRRLSALLPQGKTAPIHIRGVVTLPTGTMPEFPGNFFVQDGTGGIEIETPLGIGLATGDEVFVCGTVALRDRLWPEIVATAVSTTGVRKRTIPRTLTIAEAHSGSAWAGELVRVQGEVDRTSSGETGEVIVLGTPERQLRAYTAPGPHVPPVFPATATPGAVVELTGILIPFGNGEQQIRLRSISDVVLVRPPPQVTAGQIRIALAIAFFIAAAVGLWVWMLRRSIATQTREIKKLLSEAQEASRLKSQFLANMSHEIRTPLNGILGMQTILLGTPLSQDQHRWLAEAQTCTTSLLSLLNDILDVSKAEAARLQLAREPLSVREIVDEALSTIRLQSMEKGLAVLCNVDNEVPAQVLGDGLRLRQVLINLLSNALKFTASGSIRVDVCLRDLTADSVVLHFSVEDTGIGIAPANHRLIFESFRQADGSISRTYGGTGLGLAISRQIVTLMGGELRVESDVGEGSLFMFSATFGRAQQTVAGVPAGSQAVFRGSGLRLLVVEDNQVNRIIAQQLLSRAGYKIVVAEGGAEALQKLEAEGFDVVLMDVQMPGMSGLEATAQLRELERQKGVARTRVIALTALALPEDAEACRAAGMDDVVTKPWKLDRLIAAIEGHPKADQQNSRPTIIGN